MYYTFFLTIVCFIYVFIFQLAVDNNNTVLDQLEQVDRDRLIKGEHARQVTRDLRERIALVAVSYIYI